MRGPEALAAVAAAVAVAVAGASFWATGSGSVDIVTSSTVAALDAAVEEGEGVLGTSAPGPAGFSATELLRELVEVAAFLFEDRAPPAPEVFVFASAALAAAAAASAAALAARNLLSSAVRAARPRLRIRTRRSPSGTITAFRSLLQMGRAGQLRWPVGEGPMQ